MHLRLGFRFLLPLLLCSVSLAQEQPASVTFKLDFPGSNPSHYEMLVPQDGPGSYTSNGKISDQSDSTDSDSVEFNLSDSTRAQIFSLARQAKYFSGKVDSGRKNIANTGEKTLAFKDATHTSQATYNYSTIPAVQQLTAIFQGLSATLECGRRLAYFHKYEKLALDDELKKIEDLNSSNMLGDVQAIEPILKNIADDHSVMNVSRARALRLLAGTTGVH